MNDKAEDIFGKKILILAPHPDDEVVGFAASIGRAKSMGAEINVLFLTTGCVDKNVLWPWDRRKHERFVSRRHAEAEKAAESLGINISGFSDRPARNLWKNLNAVYGEAKTAAEKSGAEQIWVPAYEGGNADHDGLNAVGKKLSGKYDVVEFAEYNFFGGKAKPQEFPHPNKTERIIALSDEERLKKRGLLDIYASEKQNLGYVGLKWENFRPIADYDYSHPPHKGKLWYARFQWVPFRHPRVDFTNPQEVCDAVSRFIECN
jgi:LmbE family N-acetylglucosaminyl deacetylase